MAEDRPRLIELTFPLEQAFLDSVHEKNVRNGDVIVHHIRPACSGLGGPNENEWAKAANLREQYWLYVIYDCAATHPRLLRIQDPFAKLLVRAKGGIVIDETGVVEAAEEDGR